MKYKVRNLNVGSHEFIYSIYETLEVQEEDQSKWWSTILTIYKEGHQNTALEIKFKNTNLLEVGNPLTSSNNDYDLNKSDIIKMFLKLGIHENWNWKRSKHVISDGFKLLKHYNFDIEAIWIKV